MALPTVRHELDGWALLWAALEVSEGTEGRLEAAVEREVAALRERLGEGTLADVPAAGAVRRLFKQAGTDPTRYRPSSEALARRVLRGDPMPRVNSAVDLNNLLSIHLMLPCCVMRAGSIASPLVLRRGGPAETMASLRGPFKLEGKPLLADGSGPFGTPITDSERVAVGADDRDVTLVVWGPAAAPEGLDSAGALNELAAATAVARVREVGWSRSAM